MISVHDVKMTGKTEVEQLEFAIAQQRTVLSFNVKHFARLAQEYAAQGKAHYGVVVSNQLPFSELLRRVLNLLRLQSAEEIRNHMAWLQNYQ